VFRDCRRPIGPRHGSYGRALFFFQKKKKIQYKKKKKKRPDLVDQEDSLLVGEAVQPRRPRRDSSWSARSYTLADQEGILLVGEVVLD
jgi:hypothetical protein